MFNAEEISQAVKERVEFERRQYAARPDPDAGLHGGNGQNPNTELISSKVVLEALAANEDGDARLYIDLHRGRLCYDTTAGRWYTWTGQAWRKDTLNEAARAVDAVSMIALMEPPIFAVMVPVKRGEKGSLDPPFNQAI